MKRATLILLLLVLCLAPAASAWAQANDPFEPKAGEGSDTTQEETTTEGPFEPGDTTGEDSDGAETAETAETVAPGSDTLPVTGTEMEAWLVIAYGFVAVGAGLVVLHRLRRVPERS